MKKNLIPFYVIVENVNTQHFEKYDVMPYLVECYKEAKKRKTKFTTYTECREFIDRVSKYQYWARCEYEVILTGWPNQDTHEKVDVYWQVMNNIDLVTRVFMENVGLIEEKTPK